MCSADQTGSQLEVRGGPSRLGKFWPLIAVSVLYLLIIVLTLVRAWPRTQGHLVYNLDDAYLHMATAQNLVLHGVFGVTRYGFTSSSSSILWPLVLSLSYWMFGPNEVTPLILNLAFSLFLLGSAHTLLNKHGVRRGWNFAVLLALLLATPLPTLTLSGMSVPLLLT